MPVRPPRRIFRNSSRAASARGSSVRPALMAGLIGATVGAIIMLLGLPSELFGRVPPVTGTLRASPEQVAVVDGQTLLLQQTIIHLQGIVAPSRGEHCSGTDGADNDCGAASAAALAQLVRGHDVSCSLNGRDSEGLAQGMCEAAGTDLNRAQVAQGWARARGQSINFASEETAARDANRGLWSKGAF